MEVSQIYALICPISGNVRYIGKSDNAVNRYKSHLRKRANSNLRSYNWIQSLLRHGLKPEMEILDEIPYREWEFWERHYISLYRSWGFDLTNLTLGGDSGSKLSQETKNKISSKAKGRKQSLEQRLKHSALMRGLRHSEETKKIMSIKRSKYLIDNPEAKKIISETHKGRKKSAQHLEKIKTSQRQMYIDNPSLREEKSKERLKYYNDNPGKREAASLKQKEYIKAHPEIIEMQKRVLNSDLARTRLREKICKPVLQLDLNGDIIKRYPSASDAKIDGFIARNISQCCCGDKKTHMGYKWKFKKDHTR